MNQRQYGFSFIELIIALLLSSVLSLVLYAALNSAVRVMRSVDARVAQIAAAVPVYNYLEKDCSGMFGVPALDHQEKQEDQVSRDKSKQDKKVTQWCVATVKDSFLDTWTFLTTHVLVGYNEVRPCCVRVVYRCVSTHDGLMQLQRAECLGLKQFMSFDDQNMSSGFVILDNIKRLEVTFFVRKNDEDDAVDKILEYESSMQWNSDERLKNKKMPLPEYVEFFAVCKDSASDAEYEMRYRFWCCTASDVIPKKQQAFVPQPTIQQVPQKRESLVGGQSGSVHSGNLVKPVQQPIRLHR